MWNCHILGPHFVNHGQHQCHSEHVLVFLSRPTDCYGGIQLTSFILAQLIIAKALGKQ